MALLALGVRLTWKRVLVVVVSAGAVSFLVAFLDWLGPASNRTHLGKFFQTVLDGGLWGVVWRKLDQNISILFGNRPLTILAICGVLTVVYVLARPIRTALRDPSGGEFAWLSSGTPINSMGRDTPMLGPGLVGMAIALGIGLGINDSGIAIPALGVSLGVPLLIAATTTWMLGLRSQGRQAAEATRVASGPDADGPPDEEEARAEEAGTEEAGTEEAGAKRGEDQAGHEGR